MHACNNNYNFSNKEIQRNLLVKNACWMTNTPTPHASDENFCGLLLFCVGCLTLNATQIHKET